jgi:hypothetical protein
LIVQPLDKTVHNVYGSPVPRTLGECCQVGLNDTENPCRCEVFALLLGSNDCMNEQNEWA